MDYTKLIRNLPINNFHRFDEPRDWLEIYSHHYPTEDQREEIYRMADYQTPSPDDPSHCIT